MIIVNILISFILFQNSNAQINLSTNNLACVCSCESFNSTNIILVSKNIQIVDPATFSGLVSLQRLYLNFNQLEEIHQNTFNGLTSLRTLYMHSNQIAVQRTTFNGLTSLEELWLYSN